jgi:DNA-binding NarL/FixJ family response regulator
MLKRVLLADDDSLIRRLIRELLAAREDWHICGEAVDGVEAVQKARASNPDLAILDIQMPRMDGIEAARQIIGNCRKTLVLVISFNEPALVLNAVRETGAGGFVSKMCIGSELVPAIEALFAGGTYFSASEIGF